MPKNLKKKENLILARGEATGHCHRVLTKGKEDAKLYKKQDGSLILKLNKTSIIEHEEHNNITVKKGIYEIIIQREYEPEGQRRVVD